jgi:hypothetical protein
MKQNVISLALVIMFLLIPTTLWAECKADFNNDGDVDAQDLAVFASEFGQVCNAGFTYEELVGYSFESYYENFPECIFIQTGMFTDYYRYTDGNESCPYAVNDGVLIMADSYTIKIMTVLERTESEIKASLTLVGGGPPEDRTDQWSVDFSDMDNDVNNLVNYFITNGWWPGSAILLDGSVTNEAVDHDGRWWIENNVLIIAYPSVYGCVDYKAYELVNDRLLFYTDANYTTNIIIRKIDE